MKRLFFLLLTITICACTGDDEKSLEQEEVCLHKEFMESFTIEPGQCVTLKELPNKTFTLLKLDSFEKRESTVPHATIAYGLEEENSYFETMSEFIYEDYMEDGTSFSGRIHIVVDGNVDYTIYVDNIEFTETETEYTFQSLTVRFADYDPEY